VQVQTKSDATAFLQAHPSRKNKNAARVGHPFHPSRVGNTGAGLLQSSLQKVFFLSLFSFPQSLQFSAVSSGRVDWRQGSQPEAMQDQGKKYSMTS
jgi:hypothetical protein